MNDDEHARLTGDLRALFAELRRLGYLDGYEPAEVLLGGEIPADPERSGPDRENRRSAECDPV